MKKLKYIFFGVMINFLGISIVNASPSATLTVSNTSIVNGGSVTATVTLKETMAWDIKITSSGNTSGCTQSFVDVVDSDTTKKLSVTCKSTGIGTITFKMSGAISNSKREKVNISGSKTVNVVKPREKSKNNNLKSLSVDGYSISPTFNKNTLEYTVNLESSVEKIKINATKEDGYASVSGTGEKEVQEGDNRFEIKVTSETGSSKVYTVNAIVKDSNPIVKNIDGKDYTVVKRASALKRPEAFEETTVTMNEIDIPAFYNEITQVTLIGLKSEDGSIYLYRYDAKTDTCTKYESLTSVSKTIVFDNIEEKVENFIKTKVTIDNQEYNAYQHQNNKNYVLIYGTDLETGDKNWYLYNIQEKSIQIYMIDIIDSMQNDFDNTIKEYKLGLLGMIGLSLLLLLIVMIQIISKNKMKKSLLKKIQKEISDIKKEEEPKTTEEKNNDTKSNAKQQEEEQKQEKQSKKTRKRK